MAGLVLWKFFKLFSEMTPGLLVYESLYINKLGSIGEGVCMIFFTLTTRRVMQNMETNKSATYLHCSPLVCFVFPRAIRKN